MGTTIESRLLSTRPELYRLIIYSNEGLTHSEAVSLNKPLAEELLKLKPSRRTMRLEKCFRSIMDSLPDGTVIKDIDVMFNPEYQIDVMKMLVEANKQKPFSVIWSGRYSDGKLIYSEESLPDYKVYEISDYDIYCVI